MMECCYFTYEKFRMSDGELDDEKWHKLMQAYDKAYPNLPVERKVRMYLNPCDCECHREGYSVLH